MCKSVSTTYLCSYCSLHLTSASDIRALAEIGASLAASAQRQVRSAQAHSMNAIGASPVFDTHDLYSEISVAEIHVLFVNDLQDALEQPFVCFRTSSATRAHFTGFAQSIRHRGQPSQS